MAEKRSTGFWAKTHNIKGQALARLQTKEGWKPNQQLTESEFLAAFGGQAKLATTKAKAKAKPKKSSK